MHYLSYSLNGGYEMAYSDRPYLGTAEPGADLYETAIDMPDSRFDAIPDAVPAYWEDMTDRFATAQFFRTLRVNPEYGLWRYPITEYAPDMALPNIIGTFSIADPLSGREKRSPRSCISAVCRMPFPFGSTGYTSEGTRAIPPPLPSPSPMA